MCWLEHGVSAVHIKSDWGFKTTLRPHLTTKAYQEISTSTKPASLNVLAVDCFSSIVLQSVCLLYSWPVAHGAYFSYNIILHSPGVIFIVHVPS